MSKKKQSKSGGLLGRIIRRFFLLLFTIIILLVVGLALVMNLVFNGPSPAARDVLTMSLLEPSATKWIPGLFMSDELVDQIKNKGDNEAPVEDVNLDDIVIMDSASMAASDEWAAYPDGIRIEDYAGKTFNAHIMLIQDPSRVYLGLSSYDGFSTSKPGKRLNVAIEDEGASAAINAGAFNDDGTACSQVGSVPAGALVEVYATTLHYAPCSAANGAESQAMEMGIRDGCEFGPVLIVNGVPNQQVYSGNSGYNPRTVVGQRADGVIIFICADGRQAGSLGATYKDMIDLLTAYGAVNACNMDGGSSSVMLYRDYTTGQVRMINSYSVLQSEPRRMPNFWMVSPKQ